MVLPGRLAALLAVTVATTVAGGLALPVPGATQPSQPSFPSAAAALVDVLGLPDDARDVSPIRIEAPDGTSPEIARRFFRGATTADQVRDFYRDRCTALGMADPSPDWLGHSPEMICVQTADDPAGARVYLYADCDGTACQVALEVRL